tara:strand:- start:136 stop:348 length:213 start_codon:yes stop_codon:yes gene_type:complete
MPLEWMRRANRSKANTTTGDLYANKFEEKQAERARARKEPIDLRQLAKNQAKKIDPREIITSPPEVWASE